MNTQVPSTVCGPDSESGAVVPRLVAREKRCGSGWSFRKRKMAGRRVAERRSKCGRARASLAQVTTTDRLWHHFWPFLYLCFEFKIVSATRLLNWAWFFILMDFIKLNFMANSYLKTWWLLFLRFDDHTKRQEDNICNWFDLKMGSLIAHDFTFTHLKNGLSLHFGSQKRTWIVFQNVYDFLTRGKMKKSQYSLASNVEINRIRHWNWFSSG